jgi:malonate transporter
MQALLDVILPVFLVIGFGYVATWRGLFKDEWVEGLVRFTQGFAIPMLIFRGITRLDLSQGLDWPLLTSFYAGALAGFAAGLIGARFLFGRSWEDSIAIGFCGLFSNSVLLGLPITERAYGQEALGPNYTIIAFHAPFCYLVGVSAMEIVLNRGGGLRQTLRAVALSMFRNALVVGIGAGFAVNLLHIPLPGVLADALDMMIRAALPTALFGLGGVLYRYKPEGDLRIILWVCAASLVLHPAVTWTLGHLFGLGMGQMRSAVLTASMAPGVNAYVFANMYGRARRVAASSVLIATGLTVFTAWGWLALLP